VKLFLKNFRIPLYVTMIGLPQRHETGEQTDRRTTCRSNRALCVATRGKITISFHRRNNYKKKHS